ncbi:DUF3365 domain-containing protein [Aerosakkonema sp. BLCC-F183]|uniref:c-type heme family protein n=1 Tax=Aerosakkonema sp. BLCC-F183 TaxID=3342834 RepID=UPI0035B83292
MLKNLKLETLFTLLTLVVVIGALVLSGVVINNGIRDRARNEITTKAGIMMKTMIAVHRYTNEQVKPKFGTRLAQEFIPESVSFFAAREVFERLRQNPEYQDFFYKEATLNPTNIKDKADDFETQLIERFRKEKALEQVEGYRDDRGKKLFYVARPAKVTQASCLECHDTPEKAPPSMVAQYGKENGFGWKLNEIVGAQMIAVPVGTVFGSAQLLVFKFLGTILLALALLIAGIKLLLNRFIVEPIDEMTRVTKAIVSGERELEFEVDSKNEIGNLKTHLNRMKRDYEIEIEKYKESLISDTEEEIENEDEESENSDN